MLTLDERREAPKWDARAFRLVARSIIVVGHTGPPDGRAVSHAIVTMRCIRDGMTERQIWYMLVELTDLGYLVEIVDDGANMGKVTYYKRTPNGETLLRSAQL